MTDSIVKNERFVYLMLAAKEHPTMRDQILGILRHDDLNKN